MLSFILYEALLIGLTASAFIHLYIISAEKKYYIYYGIIAIALITMQIHTQNIFLDIAIYDISIITMYCAFLMMLFSGQENSIKGNIKPAITYGLCIIISIIFSTNAKIYLDMRSEFIVLQVFISAFSPLISNTSLIPKIKSPLVFALPSLCCVSILFNVEGYTLLLPWVPYLTIPIIAILIYHAVKTKNISRCISYLHATSLLTCLIGITQSETTFTNAIDGIMFCSASAFLLQTILYFLQTECKSGTDFASIKQFLTRKDISSASIVVPLCIAASAFIWIPISGLFYAQDYIKDFFVKNNIMLYYGLNIIYIIQTTLSLKILYPFIVDIKRVHLSKQGIYFGIFLHIFAIGLLSASVLYGYQMHQEEFSTLNFMIKTTLCLIYIFAINTLYIIYKMIYRYFKFHEYVFDRSLITNIEQKFVSKIAIIQFLAKEKVQSLWALIQNILLEHLITAIALVIMFAMIVSYI